MPQILSSPSGWNIDTFDETIRVGGNINELGTQKIGIVQLEDYHWDNEVDYRTKLCLNCLPKHGNNKGAGNSLVIVGMNENKGGKQSVNNVNLGDVYTVVFLNDCRNVGLSCGQCGRLFPNPKMLLVVGGNFCGSGRQKIEGVNLGDASAYIEVNDSRDFKVDFGRLFSLFVNTFTSCILQLMVNHSTDTGELSEQILGDVRFGNGTTTLHINGGRNVALRFEQCFPFIGTLDSSCVEFSGKKKTLDVKCGVSKAEVEVDDCDDVIFDFERYFPHLAKMLTSDFRIDQAVQSSNNMLGAGATTSGSDSGAKIDANSCKNVTLNFDLRYPQVDPTRTLMFGNSNAEIEVNGKDKERAHDVSLNFRNCFQNAEKVDLFGSIKANQCGRVFLYFEPESPDCSLKLDESLFDISIKHCKHEVGYVQTVLRVECSNGCWDITLNDCDKIFVNYQPMSSSELAPTEVDNSVRWFEISDKHKTKGYSRQKSGIRNWDIDTNNCRDVRIYFLTSNLPTCLELE